MVETTYKLNTPVFLALLSDLHGRDPEPVLTRLREHMQTHPIDIIALTGDFIYGSWPEDDRSPLDTQEYVLPFLSGCAEIAPTFVSLGNHEQMLDKADHATIKNTGVTLLDNEYTTFTLNKGGTGIDVIIGGLTSAYVTDYRRAVDTLTASERGSERYPRKDLEGLRTASERLPETAWLQEFTKAPGFHVVLSHHPEYVNYIPKSINLILNGHAHGGQIRMYNPFKHEWFGLFSPGQGWLPKLTSGVIDNRLVISRGLSNTARIPRICNPVEIVYVVPQ